MEVLEMLNFKVQFKKLSVMTEYQGFPIKDLNKVIDSSHVIQIEDANLVVHCDESLIKTLLVSLSLFVLKFIKDGGKLLFKSQILQPIGSAEELS